MMRDPSAETRRRVMIVDDDQISADLLATSMSESFAILTLTSGEACLAHLSSFRPHIVLLDIEMGGIDGYVTCHRLRKIGEEDAMLPRPAVIFVSSHDTLEERLQAYESGGDDFIVKPPEPSEVLRKVTVMVSLGAERERLLAEKDSVQRMAMSFLSNLGESGTALQFMRNGLACTNVTELADVTIATLREYGLHALVQLRPPGECLTFAGSGVVSPLEESVMAQVRDLDRIFQFRRRLVINYSHVSLLVNDLPIEDEERCGRLRDHLAIIAEGCEASLLALMRTAEIEARTRQLQQTAAGVREAITTLRDQYRRQQAETGVILHQLNERFAKEMMHMALSERQEDQLQALLSGAVNDSLELFQRGLDFDSQLGALVMNISESS